MPCLCLQLLCCCRKRFMLPHYRDEQLVILPDPFPSTLTFQLAPVFSTSRTFSFTYVHLQALLILSRCVKVCSVLVQNQPLCTFKSFSLLEFVLLEYRILCDLVRLDVDGRLADAIGGNGVILVPVAGACRICCKCILSYCYTTLRSYSDFLVDMLNQSKQLKVVVVFFLYDFFQKLNRVYL